MYSFRNNVTGFTNGPYLSISSAIWGIRDGRQNDDDVTIYRNGRAIPVAEWRS